MEQESEKVETQSVLQTKTKRLDKKNKVRGMVKEGLGKGRGVCRQFRSVWDVPRAIKYQRFKTNNM